MSISTRYLDEAGEYQIVVAGKFDFSLLNEFRDAYERAPDGVKKYAIDMRAVDMIDSSALGMLLKMKRSLNLSDGDIQILNCSDNVKKILMIAKFELMFSVQ